MPPPTATSKYKLWGYLPPTTLKYKFSAKRWGKDIDPIAGDLTEEDVNTYMYHIGYYETRQYKDIMLWDYFREDFEGWTKNTFALGNRVLVRSLRDFLREYGCYVTKDGRPIPQALESLLCEQEQHEWTEEEIAFQAKSAGGLKSRLWNPDQNQRPRPPYWKTPQPESEPEIEPLYFQALQIDSDSVQLTNKEDPEDMDSEHKEERFGQPRTWCTQQ